MKVTHILADAGLAEVLEELELSEGTQAKHRMVEGRDFLDRDLPAARAVDRGAYDSVRALANNIENLVLRA